MNNEVLSALEALKTAITASATETLTKEEVKAQIKEELQAFAPKFAEHIGSIIAEEVGKVKVELEAQIAERAPIVHAFKIGDAPAKQSAELYHKEFDNLLKLCIIPGANIYLYGPPGTGKTTTGKQLADIFGVDFYYNGALLGAHEIAGYQDAGGVFHETPFYKAFKYGGIYLFDELDASQPEACLAFNAALANGFFTFANGEQVQRHEKTIIIAAGNSTLRGDGASAGIYRNVFDSSFIDRFIFLNWPYDTQLEKSIAKSLDAEKGEKWHKITEKARKIATSYGITGAIITPRATINAIKMEKSGISEEQIFQMLYLKGLDGYQAEKLREALQ